MVEKGNSLDARSLREITLITSDSVFADAIVSTVARQEIGCRRASDVAGGLDLVASQNARVVVLDLDLEPDAPEAGLEALRRIKAADGGVLVITAASALKVASAIEVMQLGAEACLVKPLCDVAEATAAVQQAFEKIDLWWKTLRALKKGDGKRENSLADASTGDPNDALVS